MTDSYVRTISAMGTVVTIRVVGHDANEGERAEREAGVARALEWFTHITEQCSRFDPTSELSRLTTQVGVAVPVSTLLFESLKFARAVAADTYGAFDPTVGHRLEERARSHRVLGDFQIVNVPVPVGADVVDGGHRE